MKKGEYKSLTKIIMGIQLQQRHETSLEVQNLLTEYGCVIKTRIGVHQASDDSCSERGLIILDRADGSETESAELENALSSIKGVTVKKMIF